MDSLQYMHSASIVVMVQTGGVTRLHSHPALLSQQCNRTRLKICGVTTQSPFGCYEGRLCYPLLTQLVSVCATPPYRSLLSSHTNK